MSLAVHTLLYYFHSSHQSVLSSFQQNSFSSYPYTSRNLQKIVFTTSQTVSYYMPYEML